MRGVAEELDGSTVVQEIGTVVATGGELSVRTAHGTYRAKIAYGCLVAPDPEDRVLVATSEAGECFVLSVLERPGDGPRRLAVEGDLRVQVRDGRLAMSATEGMDLGTSRDMRVVSQRMDVHTRDGRFFSEKLDFVGRLFNVDVEKVKGVFGTIDHIADRMSQKVRNSYRQVEELDVTRAGQLDMRAKQNVHVRGRNTLMSAELLAKVDAEQIHLG
ncbi:MAG TPA: DUF3540 domain-containing protein [Sandaracinaceae bacterium LLY-WYZ-13_1]|nr:DUF3540 domain-containing protein [Sandaracinaceae bacterium LLY-WYZ-13_1]